MRISDWSADGCSADLAAAGRPRAAGSRGGKPDRPSERRRAAAGAAPEPRHDRRSARSGDSLSRPRNYPDLPTLAAFARSEEHTSELQSLMRISYAVFCLKKKKNSQTNKHHAHVHVTK